MNAFTRRFLLRIVLPCLVLAALWIPFADRLIAVVMSDQRWLAPIEQYTDWVFVLVSSMLLYFLFRCELRRRGQEEQSRGQTDYDILTGLPNRTLLHERLRQALLAADREAEPVALVLMDLDRFREINDTFDHRRGDLVLQQIGVRLQQVLGELGTVARLGGDEFALLLPGTGGEGAVQIVHRVLKALEEPFTVDELPLAVGASFGVVLYPDHGTTADHLIQRADIAMYLAKEQGSGHCIYASGANRHNPRRLALMGQLRGAIERGELVLYYQPKISLQTRTVIGAEALVRWRHPEFGLVQPNEFIGPVEQSGLIQPLTAWALNTALRQCGAEMSIAVNLSRRNLHDPHIPELVADALRNSRVRPDRLVLEITESAIMADPTRAMEILTRLHQMGVRLSIDDFGTGYSSLAALRKLPVHEIKIDRVFVKNIATDDDDAIIVRSIIDLAYTMGKEMVAEGVEDAATLEQLAAMGCQHAQGFYMSKPLPIEEFKRWISESPWGLKQAHVTMGKATILVADDDADIVGTLMFRLQQHGYHVLMARDGVEALTMVRQAMPDLVILDVMMPKENGYRVAKMIKEDEKSGKYAKKMPVILLTARNLKGDRQREQLFMDFSHADAVVYKPFELDDLIANITRLLPQAYPGDAHRAASEV